MCDFIYVNIKCVTATVEYTEYGPETLPIDTHILTLNLKQNGPRINVFFYVSIACVPIVIDKFSESSNICFACAFIGKAVIFILKCTVFVYIVLSSRIINARGVCLSIGCMRMLSDTKSIDLWL